MKDFFKWFKSSAKMKRWLLLMLIGIVLVCYGVAKVLIAKELSFSELAKIILSFTVGFTFAVVSIICIQRRTLELLVQETDTRDLSGKEQVHSLIFNKKVYNQGPKIVGIGGGSGLNTVLKGLKNYTDNITAIVTVSNYGENITPLNDIKDSLIALSTNEDKMRNLMNTEVQTSRNETTSFSNLYFNAQEIKLRIFDMTDEEMTKFWGSVIEDKVERVKYWLGLVQQNLRFSNDLMQNNLSLSIFNGMSVDKVKNELEKIYIAGLHDKIL